MIYSAYEAAHQLMAPVRQAARAAASVVDSPANLFRDSWGSRAYIAGHNVFEMATRRYAKPEWRLDTTTIDGTEVPITVETVLEKPFGRLIRFRRDPAVLAGIKGYEPQPRVLIVAPMSGHYATLLRGTVEAMLPGHEVFITDWTDARDVPVLFGRFDLNTYIDYLIEFIRMIGPGAHTMAVCQPGPPLLAACSIMAEENDPCRPRTMTFMGSPIDARKSPTVTNILAEQKAFEWFEENMIQTVPAPYGGMTRKVYPGFIQLFSFMSMNMERHVNASFDYYGNILSGEDFAAKKHEVFYDEYLAVCDMTAEFYLQTIHDVFQEYLLPRGLFTHNGKIVDPSKITDIGLMTVEGELDDISGIGQTQAAHDLCSNIPQKDQLDHVQKGAGHYGVFNGSKWRNEIQPKLAKFILERFSVEEEREILRGHGLKVVGGREQGVA
ncbi:polyhydroxyalkanoate depolymerase [Parvularcula sp. ZS-1/3]|uniref:Polyhydroxyalkanoate depolymerase n=1 Tax=Parvularcula mediterranea TaxID=2732508 RepID=A0A7Y3RKI5_9PROT|nr:polyhydroxyalkanoate depolymerase [Parvularcula mediterranea]NNU15748.1 polyhydroxyalkanoate depolymerase [Parvularcula mediterranea]